MAALDLSNSRAELLLEEDDLEASSSSINSTRSSSSQGGRKSRRSPTKRTPKGDRDRDGERERDRNRDREKGRDRSKDRLRYNDSSGRDKERDHERGSSQREGSTRGNRSTRRDRSRSTSRSRHGRSRSKSRGARSRSLNARAHARVNGRERHNRNRQSSTTSNEKDKSEDLDSSLKSEKVSENELLDFLTTPKPTRRQGERRDNRGDRKDRESRRERVKTRERNGDLSPRPPINRPPKRTSSLTDLTAVTSSSNPPRRNGRSEPEKREVRRAKSNDSDLDGFFALTTPSRRRKPLSGGRSVASSPAGVGVSRSRKKKMEARKRSSETKQPSSRSTVTTEDPSEEDLASSDQDDISDDFKEMKFAEAGHKSLRDKEMERDMQIHMNRTDNLLYSVFPKHIAEALRQGKKVEPENHECVTIFFSDIVGFTDISSTLDPIKISDMLDRLYHSFDTLSHYHDVFKVETIGDAYMAVTNLTKEQPDHCKRIVQFAIDAIRVANQTLIDTDDPERGHVNIRVGFHSGSVVSSVVGSRNPRYCLFGDAVNTASRMESNSEVNRIHCSEDSAKILQSQHPEIKLASRGFINVKGKGKMQTYWVNEDKSIPEKAGIRKSFFKMVPFGTKGDR